MEERNRKKKGSNGKELKEWKKGMEEKKSNGKELKEWNKGMEEKRKEWNGIQGME